MNFTKLVIVLSTVLFTLLYAQSINDYKMDCDAGSAEACYQLGELYASKTYKRTCTNSQNFAQKTIELYKKSCKLGYAKGCTKYGINYAADHKKDPNKNDIYYFQKACDEGDETGCNLLNMMTLRQ